MYKLFLCLRYLRSRVIAYFAILAVALCVTMMVIVVSVMNGFLNKIEQAAKGLFGDIVIEASSQEGIARYDELMAAIRRDVPEVEAATPFIISYGVLQIPRQTHIRVAVQVAGIRLPERAQVTDFAQGLFVQGGLATNSDPNRKLCPTFDPNRELVLRQIAEEGKKTDEIIARERARLAEDGKKAAEITDLLDRLRTAKTYQDEGARHIRRADADHREIVRLWKEADKAQAAGDSETVRRLEDQIADLQSYLYEADPNTRAILGLGLPGLSIRTEQGETVRYMVPGSKVLLYIFPLGREISPTGISPNMRMFSVADDCRTDVWSIDSGIVYVPFDTLQVLNNMDADRDRPKRCSQIQLKVRGSSGRRAPLPEGQLREVAGRIRAVWLKFRDANPGAARDLEVKTWRQRQEAIIAPIESQRTLVTTMCGVISLVAVVLIFVIFYMIVLQKTREIGVMKALGAPGKGVAAIFLAYGSAVGLVGGILGTIGGRYFVHYINPIADWIGRWLGIQPWSRKSYMFEKIPNTVDWTAAAFIVAAAMLAGLIGALAPAIWAARMQPVEALRYE